MENSTTLEGLEGICVNFCCGLLEKCICQRKNGVGRAVKQIQDYLEEHYTEEANLEKSRKNRIDQCLYQYYL